MAFIPQPGHFQPEHVWGDCGVAKSFKATASFGNLFFKCRRFFAYGKGVYLTLTLGNRGLSTALHFRVYVVLDPQDDSNNACHPQGENYGETRRVRHVHQSAPTASASRLVSPLGKDGSRTRHHRRSVGATGGRLCGQPLLTVYRPPDKIHGCSPEAISVAVDVVNT